MAETADGYAVAFHAMKETKSLHAIDPAIKEKGESRSRFL